MSSGVSSDADAVRKEAKKQVLLLLYKSLDMHLTKDRWILYLHLWNYNTFMVFLILIFMM